MSVGITVVDDQQRSIGDAVVTFSVNGGAVRGAQCVGTLQGGCSGWYAGEEEAGMFTVQAKSADGTLHALSNVYVDEDECHVHPETVKLVLH